MRASGEIEEQPFTGCVHADCYPEARNSLTVGLLIELRSGTHGVIFAPPANLIVESDNDAQAHLVERERGVAWYLFFFPDLFLDLRAEHEISLRRDVDCHARYLLESMRRAERPPREPPLTVKAVRSPVISCERVVVDGRAALSILHRMAYQPGREIVMGHLLLPLPKGLFEVRWLALAKQTGFRESVLFARAATGRDATDPLAFTHVADTPNGLSLHLIDTPTSLPTETLEELMATIEYDDPRHDADFPDHVLTIARASEKWIREDADIRVIGRSIASPPGEFLLREIGCAVKPPPRFALDGSTRDEARFHRVSLAGNDGVQYLSFVRRPGAIGDFAVALEDGARAMVDWRAGSVTVFVHQSLVPLSACAVVDGEAHGQLLRVVSAGFTDVEGRGCLLTLATTQSQPADDLVKELAAMAESFRIVPRPWWRFW